jgi:hypothetical protein
VFRLEHEINLEKEKQYKRNISGVFITFEKDSDVRRSKQIMANAHFQIFGKKVQVKRA